MKKVNKFILGAIVFALVSCNKAPIDQVGPNICPTSEFDFKLEDLKIDFLDGVSATDLGSLSDVVDFSKGGINIHGDFGEVVQWEVKITNDIEQRTYSGESDTLDLFWYGQGDRFDGENLQFSPGNVRIELEVVCKEIITKNISVKGVQSFSNMNSKFGVLLRDWDQNGDFPISGNTYNASDGWFGAAQQIVDDGPNGIFDFDYQDLDPSPAGGNYAHIYAKSSSLFWYGGATSLPINGVDLSIDETNSENVYVNFFVKADQSLPNCGSQVGFKFNNVSYIKTENITWTDWKLLSYKLSDFKSQAGQPLNSTNVTEFIMQVGSQPEQADELRVQYDFIVLTSGGPLFKE